MTRSGDASTDALVLQAKAGDLGAFNHLLAIARPHLHARVMRLCGTRSSPDVEASDVVQNVLVCIFNDFSQFRGTSYAQFCGWAKSIAWRRFLAALPRNGGPNVAATKAASSHDSDLARALQQLKGPDGTPSAQFLRKEVVERAIAKVPPDQQPILRKFYVENMALDEIADSLAITAAEAASVLDRGVRNLRKHLPKT